MSPAALTSGFVTALKEMPMATRNALATSVTACLLLLGAPCDLYARGLDKIVKDVVRAPVRLVDSGLKEAERGVESVAADLDRTADRVGKDLERTVDKIGEEAERGLENVAEGVAVTADALVEAAEAGIESSRKGLKELAKGDLGQALETLTLDHLRVVEGIVADAAIESSALRLVGQVAASAYGGPKGGAAFSAWYGYHASNGDWDVALTSAAVSYATSSLASVVAEIPGDPGVTWSTAGRAVASGAGASLIAGLAGGDAEARQNAFWLGAAASIASDAYRAVAETDMSGKSPTDGPVPKDGAAITGMEQSASHAGFEVKSVDWGNRGLRWFFLQENGPVMQAVGAVPGVNGGAYFHDAWMQNTVVPGTAWVVATVAPAMVLAFTATGAPLSHFLQSVPQ
jgi:hypothetical protein